MYYFYIIIALFSALDSLRSCRMWFWTSDCSHLSYVLNIHQSGVLTVQFGYVMLLVIMAYSTASEMIDEYYLSIILLTINTISGFFDSHAQMTCVCCLLQGTIYPFPGTKRSLLGTIIRELSSLARLKEVGFKSKWHVWIELNSLKYHSQERLILSK